MSFKQDSWNSKICDFGLIFSFLPILELQSALEFRKHIQLKCPGYVTHSTDYRVYVRQKIIVIRHVEVEICSKHEFFTKRNLKDKVA